MARESYVFGPPKRDRQGKPTEKATIYIGKMPSDDGALWRASVEFSRIDSRTAVGSKSLVRGKSMEEVSKVVRRSREILKREGWGDVTAKRSDGYWS